MNSPLPLRKRVVEAGQILGRHGEVGVEDHEDVARGVREAEPDGVALAASGLAEEPAESPRVRGDGPLDCAAGVVGRVAFDEDELRAGAHLGRALEDGVDVPGLVAGGDDHRDYWLPVAFWIDEILFRAPPNWREQYGTEN